MTETLSIVLKAIELFAAKHPRPPHVTAKQCADMTGKCAHTIGKMIRAGHIRTNAMGMIPIEEVDRLIA